MIAMTLQKRIDNDPQFDADAYVDINHIDETYYHADKFHPDVIFASPPCNSFSTMTMGKMWTHDGNPKHPLAFEGQKNVLSTLKLVALLQPDYWMVENPRARLRSELMRGLPRKTITQCQYGHPRMKPTDLWGVFPGSWTPRPMCKNGDPCHVAAPRGSTTGTQGGVTTIEAGRIPYELGDEIRVALEQSY